MAHRLIRPLRGTLARLLQCRQPIVRNSFVLPTNPVRNYISEMRKEAFEVNILRLLRNEIQYEIDRSPPSKPIPEFNSFVVDERPGERWIRLKKKYGENEEIKVDATMFDASIPTKKSGGDATEDDEQLHITMVVNVVKEGSDVLEFVCSVWPDTIQIRRVFTRGHDQITKEPYRGRYFKDKDEDELLDSLYDFLEARGINDELAIFLHEYMKNKDKTEFIRWMDTVKTFIEKKQKR